MEFLLPRHWDEALDMMAARPTAVPVAGGTEVMVRLNAGDAPPDVVLDLSRLAAAAVWRRQEGTVRLGATLTYTRLADELSGPLPGVAEAAAAVGSRQIRNRGTLGGGLGTASPAGDAHPMLLACRAEIELDSVRGTRRVPARDFYTGSGRTVREPDELVSAVVLPVADGPQSFASVGRRAAVTLSTASFAVALWPARQGVGTGMGGVADRPLPALAAEEFLAGALADREAWRSGAPLPPDVLRRFGELAAQDTAPVDDVRASAAYRRHAVEVLARRTLARTWEDYRTEWRSCA